MSHWIGNDNRLPLSRITVGYYVTVAMIVALILGFYKIQILESKYYAELAERNRVRAIPVMAPRGLILDREGRILADNYPAFSVLLLRDDPEEIEKHLPLISEGLGISIDDLHEQMETAKKLPKFQPIVLKPEASEADIAFVESHRADLPVLDLMMVYRRRYHRGGFLSHVTGFVGEVSPAQIERSGGRYRAGDVVGKAGLERQYNDILMGINGLRRLMVNSVGKEVGRLEEKQVVPGKPIQTTIDYDLQVVAEETLAGRKGAVVALDPRTGEVLAMVSHPAPDPNLFAARIPADQWRALNEDPDHPLLNRTIQAQLAPGSIFKIMMTAAMLESKAIPEDMTVFCPGHADFYGRTFRCWVYDKGGHGTVGLHTAISRSCNIFFYNVGRRLGIDRIAYYARELGLGKRTGIDLPGEEAGLVPSSEWKERTQKEKWYPGETISVAIGQGGTMTTPLQLAYSVGGIVRGGEFRQPHLVKREQPAAEVRFPLAAHTVEKIRNAMFAVVNDGGTATNARIEGVELCGKTGTAQLVSFDTLRRGIRPARNVTENSWFVGYAPRDNPEIVVAVLVEHGEHGSTAAAPVARDIVKVYFDKKGRRDKRQFTVDFQRYELGAPAPVVAASAASPARTAKPVAARKEESPLHGRQ